MQPDTKQSQAHRTAAESSVRKADDGASTLSELSVCNIHNRWRALPQNNLNQFVKLIVP